MTRKDYVVIATALLRARVLVGDDGAKNTALNIAVREIADVLAADNDRFDRVRFYNAAGWNGAPADEEAARSS